MGDPAFATCGFALKDVLDLLAAGATRAEILAEYPYLEDADITASLQGSLDQRLTWRAAN